MLLDTALGIIITELFASITGVAPSGLMYVLGIVFALAPDLDFLVLYFKKHEIAMYRGHTLDHRDLLHHPLLYIPVGTLLVWLVIGDTWIMELFILASLAHFIHDSIGIGWGVRWLSPFTMRNYKFFSESDGTPSLRFITSWTPRERAVVVSEKGDPNWIWNFYVRPFARGKLTFFVLMEVIIPLLVIVLFLLYQPIW